MLELALSSTTLLSKEILSTFNLVSLGSSFSTVLEDSNDVLSTRDSLNFSVISLEISDVIEFTASNVS